MSKIAEIKKEIEEYKELIADESVPADEKEFAKGEIADLEKQLAELESKESKKEEKKTDEKPKAEKKETAPKAKTKSDADCADLEEREEKAKKQGYDIDKLLADAKERKRKAKERAEARKDQPKKTPATKNREAVEKATDRVTTNIEKRAEKGEVSETEIERLINEYEDAIGKLKNLLKKIKSGKKMGKGGNTGTTIMRRGGKAEKRSPHAVAQDKVFSARASSKTAGVRKSTMYSEVEATKGHKGYSRRDGNQFFNKKGYFVDSEGVKRPTKGRKIGGRKYYENRENRTDKKKFY